MSFIEARLLDCVRYGTRYGSSFKTDIKTIGSGHERRLSRWMQELGSFTLIYSNLKPSDRAKVMDAFRACKGMAYGFRLKDWSDYKAVDEVIGIGTGSPQELQLTVWATFGGQDYSRNITKPVAGTVKVFSDGVEVPSTVDTTTGIVSFTAVDGEPVSWSGEFDKPVRFDSDRIQWSMDNRASTNEDVMSTDV